LALVVKHSIALATLLAEPVPRALLINSKMFCSLIRLVKVRISERPRLEHGYLGFFRPEIRLNHCLFLLLKEDKLFFFFIGTF